jgi:transposase InsO family protein
VRSKATQAEARGGYGWPRIWKELLACGIRVGKLRAEMLMQLHGIRAKGKRRFKLTTDSEHDLPISPNLLDRRFSVWTSRTRSGQATHLHCNRLGLAVLGRGDRLVQLNEPQRQLLG